MYFLLLSPRRGSPPARHACSKLQAASYIWRGGCGQYLLRGPLPVIAPRGREYTKTDDLLVTILGTMRG